MFMICKQNHFVIVTINLIKIILKKVRGRGAVLNHHLTCEVKIPNSQPAIFMVKLTKVIC